MDVREKEKREKREKERGERKYRGGREASLSLSLKFPSVIHIPILLPKTRGERLRRKTLSKVMGILPQPSFSCC